ncbi:hypothetical protein OS493_030068 [Desmophyllum pertusum]|uniref:Uncharacterized protein n=1 Tax=Desmophyllum pertusum TaxID=174260 RepID=A0A9W9Z911_9CNID|nr:hypothetical protein OS493_030068 [Desmophyllum pertusum]
MAVAFVANVGAAIVANHEKIAQVAGAVASLDAPGWTWFGLASEGGGRRNEMSINNGTRHSIELEKMYINWANVGAAIVANHEKIAQVAGAVASLDAPGWTWFGLASEGGGRRNEMSINNGTRHSIELEKMYINWVK